MAYNTLERVQHQCPVLAEAMRANGYTSIRQMCIVENLDKTRVCEIISGKLSVYANSSRSNYISVASKLAEICGCTPEDLMPNEDMTRFAAYDQACKDNADYIAKSDFATITKRMWAIARESMTPREYTVLKRRVVRGESLGDISHALGITREGVRQSEARAYRRLLAAVREDREMRAYMTP